MDDRAEAARCGQSAPLDQPEPAAVRVAEGEHRRHEVAHANERRIGIDPTCKQFGVVCLRVLGSLCVSRLTATSAGVCLVSM
jgi:hypothetical protein